MKLRKIYIVFPHLEPYPFDEQRYERINREQYVVKVTRCSGDSCELIRLTYGQNVFQENCGVNSWLYPVDNPDPSYKFYHISIPLLNKIEKEKPDLIVFKGMGYRLSRWLVVNCKHKFQFAFIAAGGTKDILAPYADYILAETHQQMEENFQKHQRQGRAAILPKLNMPDSFQTSESKDFDIINVGNFNELKNQETLIPLARDFSIAMVGDGPLFKKVHEAIQPFSYNVYMPGNIPREKVSPLVARSRLMVHPAHHEGLARVVMEAFACGVPVVASRRAMPNAFEHGVHGLLVGPDEIVPAARELLADDARLQEMGRNAYQYAKENCTEEAVFEVIQGMYDRVFSERFPKYFDNYLIAKSRMITAEIQGHLKCIGKRAGLVRLKDFMS